MPKQKPAILAWQLVDDEQTWQQLMADSADSSNKPSIKPRHWLLSATAFVLILASLLGAYLYRQASTGLAQVESELTTAVETEAWAASNSSQSIHQELLDPTAPASWRNRVLLEQQPIDDSPAGDKPTADVRPLLFRDGVALVQVRARDQWVGLCGAPILSRDGRRLGPHHALPCAVGSYAVPRNSLLPFHLP